MIDCCNLHDILSNFLRETSVIIFLDGIVIVRSMHICAYKLQQIFSVVDFDSILYSQIRSIPFISSSCMCYGFVCTWTIQDMIYAVPLLPLTLRFVLTVAPLNNTHGSLTKQISKFNSYKFINQHLNHISSSLHMLTKPSYEQSVHDKW